jgi:hypothetical protein
MSVDQKHSENKDSNKNYTLHSTLEKGLLPSNKLTCCDLGGPKALANEFPLEFTKPPCPELNEEIGKEITAQRSCEF